MNSVWTQIGKNMRDVIAVIVVVAVAVGVGGYIVSHQRLTVPTWVPFVGKQAFTLNAEFQTAQAVMPGQGQAVTVAGVTVGTVDSVSLVQGRAVIKMSLSEDQGVTVHRNATLLLRPKTGLKDMVVAMDPGRSPSPALHSGDTLPVSHTQPDVNLDEFLAALDTGTRNYIQLLLNGAGIAVKNQGPRLAAVLKRFDPTARDLEQISRLLQTRQVHIRHAIHNFGVLVSALGATDDQLSTFVDSSNAVLKTFADNSASLSKTLGVLPGALAATQTNMLKVADFTDAAAPALKDLEPTSKNLGPGMKAAAPALKETTPIINDEISPFALTAKPTFDELAPAVQDLVPLTKSFGTTFGVFTSFLNEFAYDPGKSRGSFLFYAAWASHNLNSVLSVGDAGGPMFRGLTLLQCKTRNVLDGVAQVNATARLLLGLLRPPTPEQGCAAPPSTGRSVSARTATPKGTARR